VPAAIRGGPPSPCVLGMPGECRWICSRLQAGKSGVPFTIGMRQKNEVFSFLGFLFSLNFTT
jgi:hypothetical protein